MKYAFGALLALAVGAGILACQKKPETPVEKVEDNIKDGLDARPHEKLRDAGENAADAARDANEAVKEAVPPKQ